MGEFYTPYVNFDLDTKIFEVGGESFLEDTDIFYEPILDWLQEFMDTHDDKITFNFKYLYYNSSSSKSILKMFRLLKSYHEAGKEVEITWYYPEGNIDLMQEGDDFASLVDVAVSFALMPA